VRGEEYVADDVGARLLEIVDAAVKAGVRLELLDDAAV
jgi:hypothetical protein